MAIIDDMRRFGARRYFEVEDAIAPFRFRDIGIDIMMAMGHRESNLYNVLNDTGVDRGVFQINMTYHRHALERMAGCFVDRATIHTKAGYEASFRPISIMNAAADNYAPELQDAAEYAYSILANNYAEASRLKLSGLDRIRFTLAAYNAGIGGATEGLKEGDVDMFTTGHYYSADVMLRWSEVKKVVAQLGWH